MINDHVDNGILMSHEYKFIFLHFYKTGGKSISAALEDRKILTGNLWRCLKPEVVKKYGLPEDRVGDWVRHLSAGEAKRLVPEHIWKSYFKFAFVRNPWDWMVSLYYYNLQDQEFRGRHPEYYDETLLPGGFKKWIRTFQWERMYSSNFLRDESGGLIVDFVGRFERLQDDFDKVCDRVGLTRIELPHINSTSHRHYSEYYDEETRELVRERFSGDIAIFGYGFEDKRGRKDGAWSGTRELLRQIREEAAPVLSVITPVLNGERYIGACLKNVIDQGCLDKVEHIVYDGGSSDRTLEIVRQHAARHPHIRLVSVPGANQSKALNEAVRLARGSIIAILNADDFYSKGVLGDVMDRFTELPQGSFLVGNLRVWNEKNEISFLNKHAGMNFNDVVWARIDFPWNPSAYFYHKSLHDVVGFYDESEDFTMDLDFIIRALRVAQVCYEDKDWGNFRLLPGTKTFAALKSGENDINKKRVFDRYRCNDIPQFPVSLPGTLWGITTFFNPAEYGNKYENYRKFRDSSQRQGLKLLVVELAFNGRPFELGPADADILVQVRGTEKNILWQKEALLNIALKKLPEDCDKVAWVDSDVLFKNDDWVAETARLLERYRVVQPFSWAIYLQQGQEDADPLQTVFGFDDGKQFYGMAYRVVKCGHQIIGNGFMKNGHMGFAWAARRAVLQKTGFYDRTPLHNGDSLMAKGFYGCYTEGVKGNLNARLSADYCEWVRVVEKEVAGSVYYVSNVIMHLWHGSLHDRGYMGKRANFIKILKDLQYDPAKDIRKNDEGIWEWASDKFQLQAQIREYFFSRKEDMKAVSYKGGEG